MNTLEIQGDWNMVKGKLREKWAYLTDNDLEYVAGQQEELYGRMQKRTGETLAAVQQAVKDAASCCCSLGSCAPASETESNTKGAKHAA